MKWSMTTVGVIILGLIGVAVIMLFQQLTTSSENDYYLLKEITEAAMFDSIDISYYRDTGELKIVKEKFVENFTRRYAESTLFIGGQYIISFYDIMEEPPKVSLLINTGILDYTIYNESTKASYDVLNNLTGIFEYTGKKTYSKDSPYVVGYLDKIYYSFPATKDDDTVEVREPLNIPEELKGSEYRNISIVSVNNDGVIDSKGEMLKAKMLREIDWARATEQDYRTDYFDFDNYAKSSCLDSKDYYNCNTKSGNYYHKFNGVCNEKYQHWIYWHGKDCGKVAQRLKIRWKYEKYEY